MGGGNRNTGRGKKEGKNGKKQGEREGGRDIHCIMNAKLYFRGVT